jgi:glycosyltransferase involved in cell wall biosynthesis
VIPTFNRSDLIGEAIRSAQAQPETAEVIVVDDGSTDSTQEVLAAFSDLRIFRTNRCERGAARNLGAREARFGFIAFLDSDDYWEPDKLAAQVTHFQSPSVTGVRFVDAGGRATGRSYVAPERAWADLPYENRFLAAPSSLVLPREMFYEVGGFPEERGVQGSEDWVFLNRLRARGRKIEIVPNLLTNYRVHSGNSTGDLDKVASCMWNAATLISASIDSEQLSRRVKGRTAGTIGRQFAHAGRWSEARSWLASAFTYGGPRDSIWAACAVASSAAKAIVRRGSGY